MTVEDGVQIWDGSVSQCDGSLDDEDIQHVSAEWHFQACLAMRRNGARRVNGDVVRNPWKAAVIGKTWRIVKGSGLLIEAT